MIQNNPTSVVAAFEMLLEEIEAEIDLASRVGARAFESRDYDRANEGLERAAQVTAFRHKSDGLRREWATSRAQEEDEEGTEPEMPRWKNATQWARKSMVKERLLRNDSPRGVWQISEAAKRFLRNGGHC